jgi:hypothetical protein
VLEILSLVAALGLWQVIARRRGRLRGGWLAIVRGALLLVVVAQAALYTWVTWRSRSVPIAEIGQVLGEVQLWTDRTHQASAALLALAAVALLVASVRRPPA